MSTSPQIVDRPAQPYVGIAGTVTMQTIASIADRIPELFGWLAQRGVPPAGAPFFRYLVIDMDDELELQVGVPVDSAPTGDGDVLADELPAGRYATVTHIGHPDGLLEVTRNLLAWADQQGLRWDKHDGPKGEEWGCRLEVYHSDPAAVPDMSQWETQLLFRLAGE